MRTLSAPAGPFSAADLLLVLALLQGTSMTLTLAVRLNPGGPAAALVTLLWFASYALAALLLLTRAGPDWPGWLLRYRLPLLLLVAGVCLSPLWSIAPALSLERAVHFTGSTVVAIAIGMTVPLPRLLSLTARVLALLIVGSVLAAAVLPSVGIENYEGRTVWRGLTASKNTLGFWSSIALLLFALKALEPRGRGSRAALLALAALSLLCLAMSVSATSVLALSLAVLVVGYVAIARGLSLGLIAALALALPALGLAALAIQSIDTAELIGRSADLTGRSELWSQTWQLIVQRPWTGFGYGAIWYPTPDSVWIQQSLLELRWTTYHAHNGLLQVASDVGLPLAALTIVFALQQLAEIVQAHHRAAPPGALFVLGFCIALLVSNYAEARLLVNREFYWIGFIALPLSLVRQVVVGQRSAQAPSIAIAPPPPTRALSSTVRDGLMRRRRERIVRTAIKRRLLPDSGPQASHAAGTFERPGGASARPLPRDAASAKLARRRAKPQRLPSPDAGDSHDNAA